MTNAVIFASGTGSRMGADIPKQFLEINNIPILVHTTKVFNNSPLIDSIVIVCLSEYADVVERYVDHYKLNKVKWVISGGKTAIESQFLGIKKLVEIGSSDSDIVLIHDGVRPFIDEILIEQCVEEVKNKGTAITVSPASETIAITSNNIINKTVSRQCCLIARAPQCFYLKDIFEAHLLAQKENKNYIDSASMFLDQGKTLNPVIGPDKNIKITTPFDFELAKLFLGDKHE